jgi:hypothetical protein
LAANNLPSAAWKKTKLKKLQKKIKSWRENYFLNEDSDQAILAKKATIGRILKLIHTSSID